MTLILSGTNGLSDVDGDASTPAIRGTDANTGIFFGSDIIGFSEGGTEAMRINADAQIVAAAGTNSLPVYTTTGDLNTGIYFPAADNIAFTTGGTIRGRWTTDGLCFNADTAAANALDDYEEGSFTPNLRGSGTAGTVTYAERFARYTKIGRLVTVQIWVAWTDWTGSPTGFPLISNLPFTVNQSYSAATFYMDTAYTLGANCVIQGYLNINTTNLLISQYTTGGSNPTSPGFDVASALMISASYVTDS